MPDFVYEHEKNAYYYPENLGLKVVAEVEYSDRNYVFDTRVVWKDDQGNFYTARDSGCSCPTPFEDYTSKDSLDKLDYPELEREVRANVIDPTDEYSYKNLSQADANDFLRTVREALR